MRALVLIKSYRNSQKLNQLRHRVQIIRLCLCIPMKLEALELAKQDHKPSVRNQKTNAKDT